MNKIILGLLISSGLSINTYAACTYNFDATQAQVDAKNAAGGRQIKLMSPISITEQKGTATITYVGSTPVDQVVTSSKVISITSSQTPLVDKAVVGTNIVATEFVFDASNLKNVVLGDSYETQQMAFQILGASNLKNEISIDLGYALINKDSTRADGSYVTLIGITRTRDSSGSVVVKDIAQKLIPITLPSDGKVRVGLYFNQVSKQVGYIINGTNYGYLNLIAENALKNIGFNGVGIQSPNPNSKFLGKTVSVQLITNKANMQFTYPTGTTDICGNAN
ncbi:DUF4882 family protein [Acinetobacter pittii]|uniref:DUF4882 family protein n=1 Tax=Acinetobacter pittii TaxID=48296 RepID=UPI0019027905|nr:DUF4882 family protein [Acinetobacter pittii]MBJ8478397.1 DUF4882 family protein [Acinetobacter pittii]MCE6235521.1 DUF4882 domain-containing protein [Acinetobacter pittii]MCE6689781.1 DUF4882 domain-containing protein [Acinetobacter pittii]MCE6697727.1 DUF4882 domain-containing protein [Acinetobacter pittii]MCU4525262.1 DUF4882 domain-containing protein [Acinetobacter pittii]